MPGSTIAALVAGNTQLEVCVARVRSTDDFITLHTCVQAVGAHVARRRRPGAHAYGLSAGDCSLSPQAGMLRAFSLTIIIGDLPWGNLEAAFARPEPIVKRMTVGKGEPFRAYGRASGRLTAPVALPSRVERVAQARLARHLEYYLLARRRVVPGGGVQRMGQP